MGNLRDPSLMLRLSTGILSPLGWFLDALFQVPSIVSASPADPAAPEREHQTAPAHQPGVDRLTGKGPVPRYGGAHGSVGNERLAEQPSLRPLVYGPNQCQASSSATSAIKERKAR